MLYGHSNLILSFGTRGKCYGPRMQIRRGHQTPSPPCTLCPLWLLYIFILVLTGRPNNIYIEAIEIAIVVSICFPSLPFIRHWFLDLFSQEATKYFVFSGLVYQCPSSLRLFRFFVFLLLFFSNFPFFSYVLLLCYLL